MITKILSDFNQIYQNLEQNKLQDANLECNCSNPGLKAECRSCPGYIEMVSQIQEELYNKPHLECTYLKPVHNSYKGNREDAKKHSQAVSDKAIQMYLDGIPIAEICQKLKITGGTIQYFVLKKDLPRRLKRYDEEFINKAIALYHELKSTTAVSLELNISKSAINTWLKQAKIPFYEQYTEEYKQKCIDLYHQVGTAAELARQMGIPKNNVRRWLLKAGITLSTKKLNNLDTDVA
ncbi:MULTISPECIES: hypothetical protein [Cyanophyceae]|uniref:hypothetical protein n=1 Tax=Cyanophyceae TaxID=3028117 RepID=UPI00232DAD80|nr:MULTISPECIES: hypothetical protein [Cyanophyceae]MDB9357830.1 hypothetical protein [Nodularia spumigena CS-587/03]MDB9319031.1 hypothetical protein [Nodularia spumigena CS-590/01A]MDB9321502.1 hypothetical protein [Nodularia spumigena CS-591/07A]MDB9324645.1 hypothetical protein [Nodularia spumigena CS-590/02]MDB9328977.1 hypothetical protein [Nodularia spumigena CS-591/04]